METYVSRVVKTNHSTITVIRPVLTKEEEERRYQDLIETVKQVYSKRK